MVLKKANIVDIKRGLKQSRLFKNKLTTPKNLASNIDMLIPDAAFGDVEAASKIDEPGYAHSEGQENPVNLDDLHDVNITSVADTEVLTYDTATSKWINAASGGAPDQDVWVTFTTDDARDTTADTTTDVLTLAGGTGISTSAAGDTVTFTNDNPFTIGGADTNVQINDGGVPYGDGNLVYNKATSQLGVGGVVSAVAAEKLKVHGSARVTDNLTVEDSITCTDISVSNPPRARMYKNAAQNMPTGGAAPTKVAFDADDYDSGSITDPASGYDITPGIAAYYHIKATVRGIASGANKYYRIYIYVNGAIASRADFQSAFNDRLSLHISDTLYVSATDAIDIRVYHNKGAVWALETGSANTNFSVVRSQ